MTKLSSSGSGSLRLSDSGSDSVTNNKEELSRNPPKISEEKNIDKRKRHAEAQKRYKEKNLAIS